MAYPQLPDRCPAVDDTTGARCTLSENHDGPHMDGLGFDITENAPEMDTLAVRLLSVTEVVLAKLDTAGVDRMDRDAALAYLGKTVAPVACIGIYLTWFNQQQLTRY